MFSLGLFGVYLNSAVVIDFFKGALQPVILLLGAAALFAALFGKSEYRLQNSSIAGILLVAGGYGLYDEYYAVLDFFYGFLPLFLIGGGIVSIICGIKTLK